MLRETRTVLKKIDCLISLYLLFLGVFVTSGAFASSVGPEARDFALNIKQAELVFVGGHSCHDDHHAQTTGSFHHVGNPDRCRNPVAGTNGL